MGIPVLYQGSQYAPVPFVPIPPDVTPTPPDPIGDGLRADAVAYWTMNEASGTRADSADSLNLTDIGSVGSSAGMVSNAASFNGTQGKFLSHTFSVDPQMCGGDFTVTFWIYINSYPAIGSATLIQKADESDMDFYTDISSQGQIDFGIVDGDFSYPNLATPHVPGTVSTGAWHFVVSEIDTALFQMRTRIDNGVPESAIIFGGNPTTSAAIRIGCNSLSDTSFYGLIDECGIWKRLLSVDEIDYLFNSGAGRTLYP